MNKNIISAIIYLIENPLIDLGDSYLGKNRVNNVGDALERYVQDLFIGDFGLNECDRNIKIAEYFSYLGNTSNPPDMMLKGGDAIEVKKIENRNSDLALNSSYPKAKLFSDNPMLTTACKNAEPWSVKDMLYVVGIAKDGKLNALTFVYGEDYCASDEIYQTIKNRIKMGVSVIDGVEFTETKELGKIKKIDPLGITNLRIRGMWHIQNPFKVFDYIYKRDFYHQFNFMAIINDEKWQSLDNRHDLIATIDNNPNAKIQDVYIKDPNNLAQLKPAKLIQFFLE